MREKLIELLGGDMCKDCYCEDCEYEHDEKSCIEHIKRKMADHLIANGVVISKMETVATDNNVGHKWIPVTERLPDLELVDAKANDDWDVYPCLCVVKHRRAKGGRYVTKLFYDGENFMDGDMCLWTFETTHWMPLPEPPKGE